MSFKKPCPSRGELEEVLRGKVVSPQLEILVQHLESCPACEETLPTIRAEDTFTDLFRGEASSPVQPIDPAVKKLIERIQEKDRARGLATIDSQELGAKSADSGTQAFPNAKESAADSLDFLAPPQTPEEVGRLGQYRILKVLGKGGMGMVLMGHDPHLDRMVAIKVMLPSIAANETAKRRFLREARTAAQLRSDHIVTIYQVSEDRGIPYLAMEYLEGAPLDKYMAGNRKLTAPQVLRIAREIAKGLADAHERNLIHRDIKPGNIWLDQGHGGRATILDFGLARFDSDAHITQSGAIIGTPAFMAPEQARGEKVDARADLFSLGCVLYRLCAGDIPFKAETTMGVLMALAMNDPTPPAKINSQIPEALSELIMKLLEKDAAKRPATAREVIARLQQIEKTIAATRGDPQKIDAVDMPTELTNIDLSLSPPMAEMAPAPGLMTALQNAQAETKPSAPPRKRRPIGYSAIVLLGLLFLGGGGIFALLQMGVIRFSNEQGDYVIATDDPDFAFSVRKGSVILEDRKTKRKYDMKVVGGNKAAGELELEVTDLDADLAFKTKNFTIRRGQEVALKAWFERKQVAAIEPPIAPAGRYALEVAFDPASYVEVVGDIVDFAKPFTWECYVQSEKLVDHNFAYPIRTEGGNLLIDHREIAFNIGKDKEIQRIGRGKLSDRPTHLAGVFTGTKMRIFVDGRLMAEEESRSNLKTKERILHIGMRFTGRIWEVRLSKTARYDKDFTPAQRIDPDADTLALYHFDEGQGEKLTDSSSNGHHGKIIGAKWVKVGGTPSTDDDRKAAEFILANGGGIWINGEHNYNIQYRKTLPDGEFRLTGFSLVDNAGKPKLKAEDFRVFAGCRHLRDIDLNTTQIGDEGIAHFQNSPNIRRISLGSTGITDKGLAQFQKRKDLLQLRLYEPKLTENGIAGFAGQSELEYLYLWGSFATDRACKAFSGCTKLKGLHLNGAKLTDAGLLSFNDAPELDYVLIGGLEYSEKAIGHFLGLKSLRSLLLYGGGLVAPQSFAGVEAGPQLRSLTILGTPKMSAETTAAMLEACRKARLHALDLRATDVTPASLAKLRPNLGRLGMLHLVETGIGAESVELLKECVSLNTLTITKTKLTEADAKVLAKALPHCKIIHDSGTYEPYYTPEDLQAVELTWKLGGKVGIENAGTAIPNLAALPKPAVPLHLDLMSNKNVRDADLAVLRGTDNIRALTLRITDVSDAGLEHLKGNPYIRTLLLEGSKKVTDAGVAQLRDCRQLQTLSLPSCAVTDKLLAEVSNWPDLESLNLEYTSMTDGGLKQMKELSTLHTLLLTKTKTTDTGIEVLQGRKQILKLHLGGTGITDTSLGKLASCTGLKDIQVWGTKVTEKGVKELAAKLPNCTIKWDGGVIEPKSETGKEKGR